MKEGNKQTNKPNQTERGQRQESVCLFVYVFMYLLVCLFMYLCTYLFVYLFIFLFARLFVSYLIIFCSFASIYHVLACPFYLTFIPSNTAGLFALSGTDDWLSSGITSTLEGVAVVVVNLSTSSSEKLEALIVAKVEQRYKQFEKKLGFSFDEDVLDVLQRADEFYEERERVAGEEREDEA